MINFEKYSEGKILLKNAQLEKKCSDADAQLNKSAQIIMLRCKNMLRYKCSGRKICSDINAQVEKYAQI